MTLSAHKWYVPVAEICGCGIWTVFYQKSSLWGSHDLCSSRVSCEEKSEIIFKISGVDLVGMEPVSISLQHPVVEFLFINAIDRLRKLP